MSWSDRPRSGTSATPTTAPTTEAPKIVNTTPTGPVNAPTNAYSLSCYGLQVINGFQFYNPGLWQSLSIPASIKTVTYGNPSSGEVNTAAGIPPLPPIPAPSFAETAAFGIFATGSRDTDPGNPANPVSQRGEVDIKYVDGPVVFTRMEHMEEAMAR